KACAALAHLAGRSGYGGCGRAGSCDGGVGLLLESRSLDHVLARPLRGGLALRDFPASTLARLLDAASSLNSLSPANTDALGNRRGFYPSVQKARTLQARSSRAGSLFQLRVRGDADPF